MLHIILQCRLLYDASHHLTVQTVVWCFTSSYSVDCCIAHCNSEQCFTSSYSADCCMMLHIIILQCRLLYDALHHHLTVQTVVWCFTSSSYSADCCMMLHIIILQCRLLYDASHHHLTVQTVVWCFTSSSYSADWTPSPPCQHPWASSRCLLGAPKLERTPRDLLPQVQLFPLSLADPSSQTEHTLWVRVRVRVSVTNVIHVTHVWNYSWQKFKQQYEVVGWVW